MSSSSRRRWVISRVVEMGIRVGEGVGVGDRIRMRSWRLRSRSICLRCCGLLRGSVVRSCRRWMGRREGELHLAFCIALDICIIVSVVGDLGVVIPCCGKILHRRKTAWSYRVICREIETQRCGFRKTVMLWYFCREGRIQSPQVSTSPFARKSHPVPPISNLSQATIDSSSRSSLRLDW